MAGVSRQTIYRFANNGKLSTELLHDGTKGVQVAELQRVFPALGNPETVTGTVTPPSKATLGVNAEILRLTAELEATRRQLADRDKALEEAARDKERLFSLVEKQAVALEHKPEEPGALTRLWRRLV